MTRLRSFLDRVNVAGAFSWPTFWVVYSLNLAVTFVSNFRAEASWWERVVAVSLGQLAIFLVLLVGSRIERRWKLHGVWRGVFALVTFGLAGAARGAVVATCFIAWGVDSGLGEGARVLSGACLAWAVLTPMSLLVDSARTYSENRQGLLARGVQLESAALRLSSEIEEMDARVVEGVRAELLDALEVGQAHESAARLEHVATEVVRPLSHELAQAVPAWPGAEDPVHLSNARVRWREVIDRAASGSPFLPAATTALVALLSVVSVWQEVGLLSTVIFVILGLVVIPSILLGSNAILRPLLRRRPLATRVMLVVVTAIVAGAVTGAAAVLAVAIVGAPEGPGVARRAFLSLFLVIPLIALPITLARAARIQLDVVLDELRTFDDGLARRVARLGMVQWSQQRSWARALHGPVQTIIMAGAARLRGAETQHQVVIVERLRSELFEVLDPAHRHVDAVTWDTGIERIQATWDGLAEVHVAVTPDASLLLAEDVVSEDIALEILREAVANAIRHGKARSVHADVACVDGDLELRITNDGQRPDSPTSGLGTQLMRDCSLRWELNSGADGVELTALLPTGPVA